MPDTDNTKPAAIVLILDDYSKAWDVYQFADKVEAEKFWETATAEGQSPVICTVANWVGMNDAKP